jgi:hypothetical protein
MTFGAPETEALYEGIAQKGFGVSILDGSLFPLGSTATSEPIEIPRSLWGRWKSLSSKGTIKDIVEMTLEGLSLLEDVIKGASQFE